MVKKIHTLKDKETYEFGLVGISSPENDYRLSWILNSGLEFSFARGEDLSFYHPKLKEPQVFHQFLCQDEETMLQFRLISNRCENGYLLEELSNIDYLIQVNGEVEEGFLEGFLKKLNALNEIILAFRIDPSTLRSRKRLLL